MLPFSRLDHIQLAIPHGGENLARTFYIEAFGLEEVAADPVGNRLELIEESD